MYHTWERWEMHTKFRSENLKVRDHMERLGIDGRIILKSSYRNRGQVVNWIDLVQYRD
jgi:hypothetical protein